MKAITSNDWATMPDDYKLTRDDGTCCVLSLEREGTCLVPVSVLDEIDAGLLAARVDSLAGVNDFCCGDYVRFPDGRMERVSFVAPREWDELHGVQTSAGGSWYLGDGYVNFSGGLNAFIPAARLRLTDERLSGPCWFFRHNYWTAGNAVEVEAPFRVYELID